MFRSLAFTTFVACAIVVAGCGGGAGSNNFVATPQTATTPVPLPSDAPYSAQVTVTIASPSPAPSGQTPQPLYLPLPTPAAALHVSGGLQVPADGWPDGTQITLTAQNTSTGSASVQMNELSPVSPHATTPPAQSIPNAQVIGFASMTFTAKTWTSGVCFPPGYPLWYLIGTTPLPTGANYYEAFLGGGYPPAPWAQQAQAAPGLPAGVAPQPILGAPWTYKFFINDIYWFCPTINTTYWWEFYAIPWALDKQAPVPAPTPHLTTVPVAADFTATGQIDTVVANDPAYNGTYTASSSDTSVVSVKTVNAYTFTLTAGAAGTATVTITESGGLSIKVPVTVTTTTIPIH
ncbi:MAG TPA: hypothetical protein VFW34_07965 [Candidatus Rubrimentiphilum sp.]|nr:hypothetical protein [Candidatus Rubrimentiphilum sp.]